MRPSTFERGSGGDATQRIEHRIQKSEENEEAERVVANEVGVGSWEEEVSKFRN